MSVNTTCFIGLEKQRNVRYAVIANSKAESTCYTNFHSAERADCTL